MRSWADSDLNIQEQQLTAESALSLSKEMTDLIQYLYSEQEKVELGKLPVLGQLRFMFPAILFHEIDVDHENPLAYQVLDYDRRTKMDNYKDYNGLVLGDWENRIAREAITVAYSGSVHSGLPRLSMVNKTFAADSRSYLHLIWPLSHNGQVRKIIVGAFYHDLVVSGSETDTFFQIGKYKIGLPFIRCRGKVLGAVKAQDSVSVPVYTGRESTLVKICKVVTHGIINPLIN